MAGPDTRAQSGANRTVMHAPQVGPVAATGTMRVVWGITLVAALCLPATTLGLRGGTNGSYFLLLLASIIGAILYARHGHGQGRGLGSREFRNLYGPVCVAMVLPLLAVLWNQVATGDWNDRPFDAPARMALVGVVIWWLTRCPRPLLRHVQWGFVAGALVGATTLGVFSLGWLAGVRPTPGFASAITFGNLALLLGAFAWLSVGWRLTRSRLEAPLKVLAGAAGVLGCFVSQSRGGWVAIPILLVVLLLVWRGHLRLKLVTLGMAAALMLGVYAGSDMVRERVTLATVEFTDYVHGERNDSSIGLRMQFWQASVDMFQEHPWTGVGAQNVRSGFQARAASGELNEAVAVFNHSHSDMLWAMAALGIPGLFALLAIYVVPLAAFLRAARSRERAVQVAGCMGVCLVCGFMVFGLTEAMFALTMNTAFYAGMTAILLALCRPDSSRA